MRFVFWDTRFCKNLKGDGACDLSFGIRISSKLLGGRGLRFVFWDTNFFQTLKREGACDLSFGIRVSAKILRGTGLAICLLGYEFPCSVFVRYKQYVDSVAAPSHQILTRKVAKPLLGFRVVFTAL